MKENLCFIETREEEYDQIMNLNLKSTYFFIQSVTKYMIAKKIKGHVCFFINRQRGRTFSILCQPL